MLPKRWLDFLYARPWLTFAVMVAFFLLFGITSVNLFVLLKMNIDLFLEYGAMVIADGALEQLADLVGSATLSIVFYLAFKVCERLLVERLTAKKFGGSGASGTPGPPPQARGSEQSRVAAAADDSVQRSV
jgi:hypothetical protein